MRATLRRRLERAERVRDFLRAHKTEGAEAVSETVLTDIAAALEEFEQTLEASRAARREHVGASGDLKTVLSEITEQVRLLDGLVRYRFGDDAELMTAWASARNVVGPFRSKETPDDVKAA